MADENSIKIQKAHRFLEMNYSLVRFALKLIVWALMGLVGFLIYFIFVQKPPIFYAYSQGAIENSARLFGLQQPQIKNDAMMRWVSQAVSEILTFNVLNVDTHMEEIRQYFTPEGYDQFMSAMNDSGLIESVINDSLRYTANSCDVVDVLNQRAIPGSDERKHIWSLDVPVVLSIESAAAQRVVRYIMRATVAGGQEQRNGSSIALTGLMMQPVEEGVCQIF